MKKVGIVVAGALLCCSLFVGLYFYSGRKDSHVTSISEPLPPSRTETPRRSSVSIPRTSNPLNPNQLDEKTEDTEGAEESDRTPLLIKQETGLQEKTSPDKFNSEDFQSDEERELDEEFERILERIVAEQPTQEEIATQARTLIVEAREAAPIVDQYTRRIHELVNQKPAPPDLWEQLTTLREESRPYIQTLANAHWFLNEENTVDALGEWVKQEAEEIFASLDWWSVGPTIPIEEWRRRHGGDR